MSESKDKKPELIFRVDVADANWSPAFCLFQGTNEAAEYFALMLNRRGWVCEVTAQDVDEKFATALVQAEFKVWPPLETDQLCEMIWDKSLWNERDRWPELMGKRMDENYERSMKAFQEAND